ncbi:T9SS type A sorting domain-containing protein, partial [Kriegella sp. EG-1]|nr:T9SS type A sorting domain-containing protein [Flavobacteriaceae bacterium EG-1]
TMLVKTHIVTVTGGNLDIDFSSLAAVGGTRHPIINAIEILGTETDINELPIANAGDDKSITLPTNSVELVGSGTDSDGTIDSYAWTKVSGPNGEFLNGANSPTLTVGNLVEGTYVFRLTVTDSDDATAFDDVVVEVLEEIIPNQNPVANAGEDKTITLPTNSVELVGSGTDSDGTIDSYAWTKVSGPNGETLSGANDATLTVGNLVEGTYVFRLTVSDSDDATAFDDVNITVLPEEVVNDFALRINAGGPELTHNGDVFAADQNFVGGKAYENSSATVAGLYQTERSASPPTFGYDIPLADGEYRIILHFAEIYWGANGGGPAGNNQRIFDVIMEENTILDDYNINADVGSQTAVTKTFDVTMSDGILNLVFDAAGSDGVDQPKLSAIEVVGLGVTNALPIADAGDDKTITLPTNSVELVGSGTDSDGTIDSYVWTKVSGPNGEFLNGANSPTLTVGNLVEGTYVFRLTVTDSDDATAFDDVVVEVLEEIIPNQNPVANAGEDKTITLPTNNVELVGSGTDSDGTIDSYAWMKVSGPNGETLIGANDAILTVGNLVEGTYVFRLTVTDSDDATAFDDVNITVLPEEVVNDFALRINAGGPELTYNGDVFAADQNFVGGKVYENTSATVATLYQTERSASPPTFGYDIPLADGEYRIILHFAEIYWGANGGGAAGVSQRIFDVTMEGNTILDDYDINADVGSQTAVTKTFDVTMSDGILNLVFDAAGSDGVNQPKLSAIEIIGSATVVNELPIADAGDDKTITLPTNSVELVGSGTDSDGTIDSYAWTKVSGPNGESLNGANSSTLTVGNLVEGTYVFRLTVTDSDDATAFDDVVVEVNAEVIPNQNPVANAGEDKTITLPTNSVELVGSGTDSDGTIDSYAWTKVSGPNGEFLNGANSSTLTVGNLVEGTYVFRLTVTDSEDATAFDEVIVIVQPEEVVNDFALRINTGGPSTTYQGNEFIADQYFSTGNTLSRPQTGLSQPYSTIRYSRSQTMSYDIPLGDGEYTVRLHFAEIHFGATSGGTGGVGSRVFDVNIEGALVEDNLDVFAQAGGAQTMLVKTHIVTVTGGNLDIDFSSLAAVGGTRHPIINAIEILGSGSVPTIAPIANAGTEVIVTLPNNTATLNGSGTDPDGGDITYEWSQIDGPTNAGIANTTSATTNISNLAQGIYIFRLTVTDDENEVGTDEVVVTVNPEIRDEVWLEAECADVGSNWSIINDNSTSGGQYVMSPSGNNFDGAPSNEDSWLKFNLNVESGTYRLYALTDTPTGDNDSFWVRINGGSWLKWNYILSDGDFSWRQLHDGERRNVFVTLNLVDGANTIDFAHREEGVGLDKLYVTKTGATPNGLGGTDFGCNNSSKGIVQDDLSAEAEGLFENSVNSDTGLKVEPNKIQILPNPAIIDIKVSLSNAALDVSELMIYDVSGRLIRTYDGYSHKASDGEFIFNISSFESGLYYMTITTSDNNTSKHKLMIRK